MLLERGIKGIISKMIGVEHSQITNISIILPRMDKKQESSYVDVERGDTASKMLLGRRGQNNIRRGGE